MRSHITEVESLFCDLLAEEETLHRAYTSYLPLLHSPALREKIMEWTEDGGRHIQALRRLEESGHCIEQAATIQGASEEVEARAFLDFFYRAEERLYFHYQNGLEQVREKGLRALVSSHLQDQMKHLTAIKHLYADFLYA